MDNEIRDLIAGYAVDEMEELLPISADELNFEEDDLEASYVDNNTRKQTRIASLEQISIKRVQEIRALIGDGSWLDIVSLLDNQHQLMHLLQAFEAPSSKCLDQAFIEEFDQLREDNEEYQENDDEWICTINMP